MPSTRSTQPRLVTEPTMKPMLAPPRHSSTPTCTRFNGACALAPVKDATSRVTATPARMDERRMKRSPADECDAKEDQERAVTWGAVPLWHNIGGLATCAARQCCPKQKARGCGPFRLTICSDFSGAAT